MAPRRPARPWTQADDETLTRLHGEGKSLHAISAEMDRSKGMVARKAEAQDPPLTWDRTRTAAAADAKHADNKARRVDLVGRQYGRAEAVMDRLEAQTFKTLVPVGMGEQKPKDLTFVPPHEEKALAQSVATYLGNAARLEAIDAGDGAEHVKSLLSGLVDTLGLHRPPPIDE